MLICHPDDVSCAREDDDGEWEERDVGMWSRYEWKGDDINKLTPERMRWCQYRRASSRNDGNDKVLLLKRYKLWWWDSDDNG
jgi:hypothetical protein